MANGETHFRANIATGLTTWGLVNITDTMIDTIYIDTIQLGIGLILGTIITPDYDFNKIYIKKVIKKIPVIGFFWNLYWYPYSMFFKHRGISHNLLFGTITRVIYLFFPIFLLNLFQVINIHISIYIIIGWYLQDVTHYILDKNLFKSNKN